ncbi:hypothetical protein LTR85_003119 [Meristemomyces frigidus]|nr:hypothetical protein LTR85_003119 [Meristemomyces frigidus]
MFGTPELGPILWVKESAAREVRSSMHRSRIASEMHTWKMQSGNIFLSVNSTTPSDQPNHNGDHLALRAKVSTPGRWTTAGFGLLFEQRSQLFVDVDQYDFHKFHLYITNSADLAPAPIRYRAITLAIQGLYWLFATSYAQPDNFPRDELETLVFWRPRVANVHKDYVALERKMMGPVVRAIRHGRNVRLSGFDAEAAKDLVWARAERYIACCRISEIGRDVMLVLERDSVPVTEEDGGHELTSARAEQSTTSKQPALWDEDLAWIG